MTIKRLGMLTPSSNTVVEPTTTAILAPLANACAHFSRFRVTEISLSKKALAQFDTEPFMESSSLLADAMMDVIAWNGTSAAWRGFHEDVELCNAIDQQFGVKATASMLALNLILEKSAATEFGLVTPYIDEIQTRMIENYSNAGFTIVAEQHHGTKVNFDFSQIPESVIRDMTLKVAASKPAAIIIVCTNLPAAHLVDSLEQETGIPIYDSTSAVVWHALRLAGINTNDIKGWGSLFNNPALQSGVGEPLAN